MIAVECTIELLEPLLATGLEGDPNAKRSLSYVPGSALRGAAIARTLALSGRDRLDPEDGDDCRLFLGDTTRYLNAYPLVEVEKAFYRTLPTPMSWQKDKSQALERSPTIYDLAILDPKKLDPQIQYKGVDDPYCCQYEYEEEMTAYILEEERHIQMHTARSRRAGRATRQEGALFQYDALAARQQYEAVILTQTKADAETLAALLDGSDLQLGGSRDAAYGAVRITAAVHETWPGETPAVTSDLPGGAELILTCLSPWLLTTAEGQVATTLENDQLAHLLGVAPGQVHPDLLHTWRDVTTVGSFNRVWGLPLPQTVAIAAGSVFSFRVDVAVPSQRLQELQEQGIGARRCDGFGRVAVNWQQAPILTYSPKPARGDVPSSPPEPPDDAKPLLQMMGKRLLRKELDRGLAGRVAQLHLSTPIALSNSLNGRLRTAIRSYLAQIREENAESEAPEAFKKLLDDLKPTAREQLRRARLAAGGERLSAWIPDRLDNISTIWQELGQPQSVKWGTLSVELPDEWRAEYTLRLIDGVLAQAARQPKERS